VAWRSVRPGAKSREAIRQQLLASGVADLMVATLKATLPVQRALAPEIPAIFWDEFANRMISDVDRLMEAVIPLYDAAFTLEEVEGLTAFYRSPLGKRLVEASNELAIQTAAVGEQWGATIGTEVALDLASRGFILGN
jgi:hypothetical protein